MGRGDNLLPLFSFCVPFSSVPKGLLAFDLIVLVRAVRDFCRGAPHAFSFHKSQDFLV